MQVEIRTSSICLHPNCTENQRQQLRGSVPASSTAPGCREDSLTPSLPHVPRQLINEGTATLPLPCCAQPRCQLLAWGFMPMSWPPTAKTLLLCNRREQAGNTRIVISKESAWMGIKWEDFRLFSSSLYVHCLTRPLHHSSECS